MPKSATQERRVKDAMFSYHVEIPNPTNPDADQVMIERLAYHGQSVDLMPHDVERGEKFGSFFKDDEPSSGEGARYASQFTHEELVEWLRKEQPSVQAITGLVDSDPDPKQAAEKLLAAEAEATGNDSRATLVTGLEAIIAGVDAEQSEEQERQLSGDSDEKP